MNTYTHIQREGEGRETAPVEEEQSGKMVMSLNRHEQVKIKKKKKES